MMDNRDRFWVRLFEEGEREFGFYTSKYSSHYIKHGYIVLQYIFKTIKHKRNNYK
jgi:hypothetical protein